MKPQKYGKNGSKMTTFQSFLAHFGLKFFKMSRSDPKMTKSGLVLC